MSRALLHGTAVIDVLDLRVNYLDRELLTRERPVEAANALPSLRRHLLPPFLGEAFGGSAGRVDVEVDRDTRDHLLPPVVDKCFSGSNMPSAAGRAAFLSNDRQHHSAPEVPNLLEIEPKLLERAPPVFK